MHVHNVQNEEHEDVAAHTSGHPGILRKPREVFLTHFGVNLSGRFPGYPGLSHGNLRQLGPGTGRVVQGSGLSHGNLGKLGLEY